MGLPKEFKRDAATGTTGPAADVFMEPTTKVTESVPRDRSYKVALQSRRGEGRGEGSCCDQIKPSTWGRKFRPKFVHAFPDRNLCTWHCNFLVEARAYVQIVFIEA